MVPLFKMAVALATKEGRNASGQFANRCSMTRPLPQNERRATYFSAVLTVHGRILKPGCWVVRAATLKRPTSSGYVDFSFFFLIIYGQSPVAPSCCPLCCLRWCWALIKRSAVLGSLFAIRLSKTKVASASEMVTMRGREPGIS